MKDRILHHALPCLSPAVALLFFLFCPPLLQAVPPPAEQPPAEILRLGERMYRDGILPSGEPLPAYIRGDVAVDSSAFSCSSCHMRAGLGSLEGGVVTPPTNGNKLYQPYRRPPSLDNLADQASRSVYAATVVERPAYTRTSLAAALRFGHDPAGQIFNDVMPRYPLSDPDLAILIRYLESLSATPSAGASGGEFRFATIISDDVTPEERQALLQPLQNFIARKNQQLSMYNDFIKFGYRPTLDMKTAFHKVSLDIWELKGAPETWQKQLAAYNGAHPVFAVLGGISNRDWRPIHDFCEAERLPCLFPITDFPPLSGSGWYSWYFNKGYAQEGEAAARYINGLETLAADTAILQIVQDSPAGRALAAGFDNAWRERERRPVATLTLSAAQLGDRTTLATILATRSPGLLLLWSDAETLPQLPALLANPAAPGMLFVSSGYLGKKTAAIAEQIRPRVYISYPYRLSPYVGPKTGGFDARNPIRSDARDFGERRITSRTNAMLQQAVLQGLNRIGDNHYRDHLLDVMSMQMDLIVKDYERLSFGPGQRYASKGCYIIQLGPGDDPPLLPRSEWVIQ